MVWCHVFARFGCGMVEVWCMPISMRAHRLRFGAGFVYGLLICGSCVIVCGLYVSTVCSGVAHRLISM